MISKPSSEPKQSLLVMAFGGKGVGDHVSCSSFVRNLVKNRPECVIDFAAFSPIGAELFRHNPYIRNIHVLDMDYLKLGGKYGLRDTMRYIIGFRQLHYDTIYVLGSKFRHAVFAFLIRGKERIGYNMSRRGFLLTKTASEPLHKNVVERFLDLLVLDGLKIFDPSIEIFVSERETEAVERFFEKHHVRQRDEILCIAPFAADMRRTWGLSQFWTTARHYAEQGMKVIIVGSPADQQFMTANPLPHHPGIIDAIGKLTILETAAALKKSTLFLGNDSGLGHIAGAVGTKSLILGYFITRVWYPVSPSVRTIIKDVGCTACDVKTCAHKDSGIPRCFSAITIGEVVETLESMLAEARTITPVHLEDAPR